MADLTKIAYSEKQIVNLARKYSRLTPIEPGDVCCNCGEDCDGDGFAWGSFTAYRVNGHPLCSRPKCKQAQWDEYLGRRNGCRCGRRKA